MSKNVAEVLNLLKTEVLKCFNSEQAQIILNKYIDGLSDDYLSDYTIEQIMGDLNKFEYLSENNQYAIEIMRDDVVGSKLWRIKLLKLNDQVSLSRGLPIIENFGVKLIEEYPYHLKVAGGIDIHVCDFGVEVPNELCMSNVATIEALKDAVIAAFNRRLENDSLNKLVLFSGLNLHEVSLLRAITQYLVQTALPFSRQYMAECLCNHGQIARNLYLYFDARFNVESHDLVRAAAIHKQIISELEKVSSLDEDRILKSYLSVIDAMLRTSFYQQSIRESKGGKFRKGSWGLIAIFGSGPFVPSGIAE